MSWAEKEESPTIGLYVLLELAAHKLKSESETLSLGKIGDEANINFPQEFRDIPYVRIPDMPIVSNEQASSFVSILVTIHELDHPNGFDSVRARLSDKVPPMFSDEYRGTHDYFICEELVENFNHKAFNQIIKDSRGALAHMKEVDDGIEIRPPPGVNVEKVRDIINELREFHAGAEVNEEDVQITESGTCRIPPRIVPEFLKICEAEAIPLPGILRLQ